MKHLLTLACLFPGNAPVEKLEDFIHNINSVLESLYIEIKKGVTEDDGRPIYALVSARQNPLLAFVWNRDCDNCPVPSWGRRRVTRLNKGSETEGDGRWLSPTTPLPSPLCAPQACSLYRNPAVMRAG